MGKSLKAHVRAYGERPKKSLGQVFLIEPSIQRKILDLAELTPADTVVEIGPGTGTLTREIVGRVHRLIALEIDRGLAAFLRESLPPAGRLGLVCTDALDFSYRRAARVLGTRLKIVGNIPYQISAPLMFTFLEQWESIARLVLMLQREVAERLTAVPGTKAYGTLTVLCAVRFDIRIRQKVPRHCFSPVPRVDSAVILCLPRTAARMEPAEDACFRKVVKSAFSKRRKTLFNALRSSPYLSIPEPPLRQALERAGVDPGRRPETLAPEEYVRLSRCIQGATDAK